MVWGTVFTNGCSSSLVGSITKVWQPITSYTHTRNMPDINDVLANGRPDFCQILRLLALTRVNISAPSRYEALYSPTSVAVGLLGPLPRTDNDNPLQAACTLQTCQTLVMCCQRCGQILSDSSFLAVTRLDISAPSCNEALHSPMIVAVQGLVGSITKVWQPFTSNMNAL